jgi:hypothetical protein
VNSWGNYRPCSKLNFPAFQILFDSVILKEFLEIGFCGNTKVFYLVYSSGKNEEISEKFGAQ